MMTMVSSAKDFISTEDLQAEVERLKMEVMRKSETVYSDDESEYGSFRN